MERSDSSRGGGSPPAQFEFNNHHYTLQYACHAEMDEKIKNNDIESDSTILDDSGVIRHQQMETNRFR